MERAVRQLLASFFSFAIWAAVPFSAAPPARGEECSLKQVASFDMIMSSAGLPMIPAMLNDKPTYLVIDTGTTYGLLRESIVRELRLTVRKAPADAAGKVFSAAGGTLKAWTTLPLLQLGNLQRTAAEFLVTDDSVPGDVRAAGLIGAQFLSGYDAEFDFGAMKLRLFLQNACKGDVVYWTRDYLETSVSIDEFAQIRMPMKLDGWNVTALLDTGSAVSILYREKSDATFGLTMEGSDTAIRAELRAADGKTSPAYSHQFKSLDLKGMIIENPWIFITTQKIPWRIPNQINLARNRYTLPPQEGLILGMDKLRRLRFYIAYGEHKLYVTAADTH